MIPVDMPGLAWLDTGMEENSVHVRASEVAASVAVDGMKAAMVVRTHHSLGSDGFSNKVRVTDVMWTGGTNPTIVFVLENGQEFEAEVRPSSVAMREARTVVDCAVQVAERAQDAAKAQRGA